MNYDVAVIGAGPGGSVAAQKLAEKGINTVLIEAKKMPRHKTCAGAVTGKAFTYLDDDFFRIIEDKLTCLVFRYNYGEGVGYRARAPFAYTVTRDRFDHYLAERASNAGARVIDGSPVQEIKGAGNYFYIHTGEDVVKARTVVGADGANSMVARSFSLTKKMLGLALETIIPLEKVKRENYRETAFLDYGNVPYGYGWIFSKSDHLNVGVGSFQNRSSMAKSMLYGYVENYFPGVKQEDLPLYGHMIPTYSGGSLSGDGVLVVGDAAGLVDPFTGEGIHYAMESGEIAANILENYLLGTGTLQEYDKKIETCILKHLRTARWIGHLFYNMPGLLHRHLVRKKRVIREFADMVAGKKSYNQLFKWLVINLPKEALSRVPDDKEFFVPKISDKYKTG